jgi:hypothetical protein
MHNLTNLRTGDAKAFRQRSLPKLRVAEDVVRSNEAHLLGSQLAGGVTLSGLGPASVLGDHVLDVFRLRSQEQMIGVDAPLHIAVMTDKESIRDVPELDDPRKAVSGESLVITVGTTISVPRNFAAPKPALLGRSVQSALLKVRKQLRSNGKLWLCHCLTSLTGRVVRHAGDVPPSPGFSLPQLYQNDCSH